MDKSTNLLRKKLEDARSNGYQLGLPQLRPGQESIMVVRTPVDSGHAMRFAKRRKIDR